MRATCAFPHRAQAAYLGEICLRNHVAGCFGDFAGHIATRTTRYSSRGDVDVKHIGERQPQAGTHGSRGRAGTRPPTETLEAFADEIPRACGVQTPQGTCSRNPYPATRVYGSASVGWACEACGRFCRPKSSPTVLSKAQAAGRVGRPASGYRRNPDITHTRGIVDPVTVSVEILIAGPSSRVRSSRQTVFHGHERGMKASNCQSGLSAARLLGGCSRNE